jgi:hypothetical protein
VNLPPLRHLYLLVFCKKCRIQQPACLRMKERKSEVPLILPLSCIRVFGICQFELIYPHSSVIICRNATKILQGLGRKYNGLIIYVMSHSNYNTNFNPCNNFYDCLQNTVCLVTFCIRMKNLRQKLQLLGEVSLRKQVAYEGQLVQS